MPADKRHTDYKDYKADNLWDRGWAQHFHLSLTVLSAQVKGGDPGEWGGVGDGSGITLLLSGHRVEVGRAGSENKTK